MTKFKVGDRVRWCVSYTDYTGESEGEPVEFGVVSDVFPRAVDVVFDLAKSDGGLYCLLDEVELVEEDKSWPQVGDKGVWRGWVYTLVDDGFYSSQPYWRRSDSVGWNPITTKGYTPYYEEETEEDDMTAQSDNQFVGTTKVIKEVINTFDSGGAKMSIEPTTKANVRLTIGAEYRHGGANCFNKRTLQELIHNLQEVCDLLES